VVLKGGEGQLTNGGFSGRSVRGTLCGGTSTVTPRSFFGGMVHLLDDGLLDGSVHISSTRYQKGFSTCDQ
jgi:hypothetical protein